MGDGFLDRVEENAAVQTWAEKTQREKGDSLDEGYVSDLWDFTRVTVAQNNLQELKEIWDQWNNEVRQLFYLNYGDLPYLLDVKVDKRLFRALAQFWNPAYSCFTFGKVTARIKQKGDRWCIPWKTLKDLILAHPDVRKRVDVLTLSIYGLVVFPKTLGHVDEAVTDLFDRLDKRVSSVPNLQEEDIEWRAPWLLPDETLYRCGDFNWVPLIGIWGAVSYAPLLVLRQYRSRQLVPATQGLAKCEFSYKDDGYKKKAREMANAWNQIRRMKRLAVGPMTTPKYSEWWVKRINDNIVGPSLENSQSIEEHLRVVPSELEIIK
ncbi:hypothetical protein Gogos_021624 [Gossypium gossypioides]|uniref:DUF7745 domain-containing protein n=1 Tax=Gossypium gossypioides TaxID=34282 RepID=A0A7J9CZN8_GOSGO|nr:hypothetical protein [Gossypium gossypioides]